ncbi:MAG: HAD-IIIA family hydrolase [Desulfobacterales bacterium]|nr:HAD-IIIA family hydrolase [Desulfobacterales bacterium]
MKHINKAAKLKQIKLLLLDVDGVLTNGTIIYDDNGGEIKTFNVRDGFGIRMLINSGIEVGIVTGRKSKALHHRCNDLGITDIFEHVRYKASILDIIKEKKSILKSEIAFIGDDIPDISIMKEVGFSAVPFDGDPLVKTYADWIIDKNGGDGVVREFSEAVLKAKGLWEEIITKLITNTE